MFKVGSIILLSLFAVALGEEEIELNDKGCPVDNSIYKILPHDNCNKFYKCSNGEPVEFQCPKTLMFSLNDEVCDWPREVDCGNRKKEDEVAEVDEESSDPKVICARAGSNGALIPHEYCNQLYMCARGVPIELQCPNPLMYNKDTKLCDWESEVECGDRLVEKEEVEHPEEKK
ncbi:peritrophin-1-like [Bicyclus anynana]|uniref:Peritrophin-1-like n=1 Tax=Bicyclus anynana TaxID=110368 RepID=A0A6J1N8I5_BICAN|nr:peritrophin-1-like [Bicyclus anynana]